MNDKPIYRGFVATDSTGQGTFNTIKESKCSGCFIGVLGEIARNSLRPEVELRGPLASRPKGTTPPKTLEGQLDETLSLDATPMHMNLIGLRRRESLTNRFDDVVIALYRAPAFDGEGIIIPRPLQTKAGSGKALPLERMKVNEDAAREFIAAVKSSDVDGHPGKWPLIGEQVGCKEHLYWQVVVSANTTDPGYGPSTGKKRDDVRELPWGIGAVEPGWIRYRCGFHQLSKFGGYVAGHARERVAAKRRYPMIKVLANSRESATAAADSAARAAAKGAEAELKPLAQQRAQKRATELAQQEVPDAPPGSPAKAQDARKRRRKHVEAKHAKKLVPGEYQKLCNERYADVRTARYREALGAKLREWLSKKKDMASEALIRVEDRNGATKHDLEARKVNASLVVAPVEPDGNGDSVVQLVYQEGGRPVSLVLGEDDVVVTRGSAGGTNFHRSVGTKQKKHKAADRTVQNWSEGCQVFRDPDDFFVMLRLLQLSKRVQCPRRGAVCTQQITGADVKRVVNNLGSAGFETGYIEKREQGGAILAAAKAVMDSAAVPPLEVSEQIDAARKKLLLFMESTAKAVVGAKAVAAAKKDGTIKAHVESVLRHAEVSYRPAVKALPSVDTALSPANLKKAERKRDAAALQLAVYAVETSRDAWKDELMRARSAWLDDHMQEGYEWKAKEFRNDFAEMCDLDTKCPISFNYLLLEVTDQEIDRILLTLPAYPSTQVFPPKKADIGLDPKAQETEDGDEGDDGEGG